MQQEVHCQHKINYYYESRCVLEQETTSIFCFIRNWYPRPLHYCEFLQYKFKLHYIHCNKDIFNAWVSKFSAFHGNCLYFTMFNCHWLKKLMIHKRHVCHVTKMDVMWLRWHTYICDDAMPQNLAIGCHWVMWLRWMSCDLGDSPIYVMMQCPKIYWLIFDFIDWHIQVTSLKYTKGTSTH